MKQNHDTTENIRLKIWIPVPDLLLNFMILCKLYNLPAVC